MKIPSQKINVLLLPLVVFSSFLMGCKTTQKPSSPPVPPPEVRLTSLPTHAVQGGNYSTSSICCLVPLNLSKDAVVQEIEGTLRSALQDEGYTVLDFGALPVSEERRRCGKVIGYGRYARRKTDRPEPTQDVVLFVQVMNAALWDQPDKRHNFYAWGRESGSKTVPVKAIHAAVEDMMGTPAFRKSLEPNPAP